MLVFLEFQEVQIQPLLDQLFHLLLDDYIISHRKSGEFGTEGDVPEQRINTYGGVTIDNHSTQIIEDLVTSAQCGSSLSFSENID